MAAAFAGVDGAAILFVLGRQPAPPAAGDETDRGRVLEELTSKYNTRAIWLLPHEPTGRVGGKPSEEEMARVRTAVTPHLPALQKHVERRTCVFLGIRPAQLLEGTLPGAAEVPALSDPSLWRQGDKFTKAFDLLRSLLPGFVDEAGFSTMVKMSGAEEVAGCQNEAEPASSVAEPFASPLVPGQAISLHQVARAIELGVDSATLAHQAALPETIFWSALKALDKDLFDKLPGRGRSNRPDRSAEVDREFVTRCREMGFCCTDLAILNPAPVAYSDVGRAIGVRDSGRDYRQPKTADPTRDDWLTTEDLRFLLTRCSSHRLAEVLRPRRSRTTAADWVDFLEKVSSGEANAEDNPQRVRKVVVVAVRKDTAPAKRRPKGDPLAEPVASTEGAVAAEPKKKARVKPAAKSKQPQVKKIASAPSEPKAKKARKSAAPVEEQCEPASSATAAASSS